MAGLIDIYEWMDGYADDGMDECLKMDGCIKEYKYI